MLSKIIKLEDIYNDYMEIDSTYCPGDLEIGEFMQVTIEAFKTLTDEVMRLNKKYELQALLNNTVDDDEAKLLERELAGEEVKSDGR